MWFKLDLNGIEMNLKIKRYAASSKDNWDEQWCTVDFSFVGGTWLNYQGDDEEILLSCEVEELADALNALLGDKINEIKTIECIEPDFKFVLHPKRDLRDDNKYSYIREGYEIADIYLEMQIYFWNGGLTDNFLSLTFDRDDIEYFRNYLYLITKKIDTVDSRIAEMLDKGILLKNYS